jgi:hypothetical protein
MIRRDFHGYLLDDAIHEVEMIIGDVRNRGMSEEVEFITGHGKIQIAIMELFNDYQISSNIQLSNTGVVVATIE